MSSRKRKTGVASPKDGSEASRAERKRIQNRISQKCHRERQAAHARHLESVVDIIKTSDQDGESPDGRYAALLRQHMKVIEEKQNLEEALFRMRKKLLSISNSASSAADDEVVDTILHTRSRSRRDNAADPLLPTKPSSQPGSKDVEHLPHFEDQAEIEIETLANAPVDSQDPESLDIVQSYTTSPIKWTSSSKQPDALFGTCIGQAAIEEQNNDCAWSLGVFEPTFHFDSPFLMPTSVPTITVTSTSIFAETILHACRRYVSLQMSDSEDGVVTPGELASYGLSKNTKYLNTVSQISAVGTHMLAVFAGLEFYVYGVGGAAPMEAVLQWRLMPTYGSRTAVPEPFRPTPLQYSTANYPLVIDFISWPAIRDQLILQLQNINIDDVVRTIVQNTVVEIPHRRISVSVHSLFYYITFNAENRTAWNDSPKSSVTDPRWKFLEVPAPIESGSSATGLDTLPAESALVMEISRRVEPCSNISSFEENSGASGVDAVTNTLGDSPYPTTESLTGSWLTGSWRTASRKRSEIVSRFGLDQVANWKLSKEFARKHPFLDCSSAVAAYDTLSAQAVLQAEGLAC